MGIYYGYARVSTEDQSEESIQSQLSFLENRAEALGMEFVRKPEVGSGKDTDSRPVLMSIAAVIKEGDILGVRYVDRLGRDLPSQAVFVRDSIYAKGAKLDKEGRILDYDDATEYFSFHMLGLVADLYRKHQRATSLQGIEQKKHSGDWIYSSRTYGYTLERAGENPIVTVKEDEADVLRYIFQQYSNGRSLVEICTDLNRRGYRSREGRQFYPATVRRWLMNPVYMGYGFRSSLMEQKSSGYKRKSVAEVDYSPENLVKLKHYPAIITEELWWSVHGSFRTVIRTHGLQFKYRYAGYELSSVLRCYYCEKQGTRCSYIHARTKGSTNYYEYYMATNHAKGCKQSIFRIQARYLEPLFRMLFYLIFENPLEVSKLVEDQKQEADQRADALEADIARLQKQLDGTDQKIQNLVDSIAAGAPTKYVQPKISKLDEDRERLLEAKRQCEETLQYREQELEDILHAASEDALLSFVHGDEQTRRKHYLSTFRSAYVFNRQIVVRTITGHTFIVPLQEHRGRRVQKLFDVRVYHRNRYRYTVRADTVEEKMTHAVGAESATNHGWQHETELHRQQRIATLQLRVDELRSVAESPVSEV